MDLVDGTMWTGEELVLRGAACDGGSLHAYNPVTDALRSVVDPLPERRGSIWTWTGTHAFAFGGVRCQGGAVEQNGALLDVKTGTIVRVTGRGGITAAPVLGAWVPSTSEVVLFWDAPYDDEESQPPQAFHPATRAWRTLPAPSVDRPRHALWTGTRLLVTGHCGDSPGAQCVDSWDPATSTWSPLSLPAKLKGTNYSGRALTPLSTSIGIVMWGAYDPATSANIGGVLNEAAGTWSLITAPAPAVLQSGNQSVFWAQDKLWVWSGGTFGAGAKWDPVAKTWSSMPLGGPEIAEMPARSTGTEVIFWGGHNAGSRGWVFHP